MFHFFARLALPLVVLVLASAAALGQQPPEPQRFALLVGVNEYDHEELKKLQFAENDVNELGDVLKKGGYEVTRLTGKDATKKAVEEKLLAITKAFPKNGVLIVAFAGHGLQFEGDTDNYFCPVDARPFKNKKDTLISLKWVYERLQEDAAAGPKLVLVDACRNDPKSGRGRGLDSSNVPNPPRGVALLMSCSPGETAWEHDSLKHGVFFHHVIQGLNGKAKDDKGEVTWDSLRGYVKREVTVDVPKRIGDGATQTPEENGRLSGPPPVLLAAAIDLFAGDFQAFQSARLREGSSKPYLTRTASSRIAEWKSGAVEGSPSAQVLYARCLEEGIGVDKDEAEAVKWYRKAADAQNPAGMVHLGYMHESGRGGLPKDEIEAVKCYQKSANAGDLLGMRNLGVMYATGRGGLTKDNAEAVKWFQKAAAGGHLRGMNNLGAMYDSGRGVPKDEAEAIKWYTKAAVGGDTLGMNNLGAMYESGRGVPKDEAKAAEWYKKAADAGYPPAMANLGLMYGNARGVPKDEVEAVKWFQKAADAGNPLGMSALAVMYEFGMGGLAKDEEEALRLYRKAANAGDPDAKLQLKRLGKE